MRWALVFLALNLVVVYAAFIFFYRDYRGRLEDELGLRLLAVATATAAAVNGEVWTALESGDTTAAALLRRELGQVRQDNGVDHIFLFDREEHTLFDLAGRFESGRLNPALVFEAAPVTSALAGLPAASRLYSSLGVYLKSAYAPVISPEGEIVGGVGVEASATFFQILERIRGTLIVAAVAVLAAMSLLGIAFARLLVAQESLEARLRRTELLAATGEMAAMLAHEIRNPLGIIRGAAERLGARHGGLREDEIFHFIPEEVDRLERTLGAYLDFARPRSGSEPGDARVALERTLGFIEPELDRRGIALERALEEGAFPVRGDAERLQQTFLNLILNARDAMPEGGTLRVKLARRGRRVEIAFTDTGEGMTEEVRRRATEPFYTSKAKGSGLGLAVVRRVVDDLGGRLDIRSRPGEGTTVLLGLPLGDHRT
jgi:signal transduction histidine kinase